MAVDERARHQLFLRMEEELGPEAAQTMMELLPPVGWGNVATKDDLRQLDERMTMRFDVLRSELRGEMHQMRGDLLQAMFEQTHALFRNLVMLCASLVVSVAGLAFAAARLS